VTVDPSGKFAYVANNFSNSISMYTINATTGALTLIGDDRHVNGSYPLLLLYDKYKCQGEEP